MQNNIPRLMIAAPYSGGGKTTVTCGLLTALVKRGVRCASFKCGPDYIDPMFHSEIIGAKSRNLDLFMADRETARFLLCKNARDCDVAVMEGVMGYYDGIGGRSTQASSYDLARETGTPVVLVVDVKGMSVSAAAVAKGFLAFRESNIAGIILNRAPESLFHEMKELMEEETGVPVFGYLPNMKENRLESRHLGLVTAGEVRGLKSKLNRIAEQMEQSVDINALLRLAQSAPPVFCRKPGIQKEFEGTVVAVARDAAFCFYYEDNIDLLREMGASVIPFSPLEDREVPAEASGLLLGGGYPELYAGALAQNKSMLHSLKKKVGAGMPVIAECGGFMYLHEYLQDESGKRHAMAGVLQGECYKTGRLRRFGYLCLTAESGNLLLGDGGSIRGHEFHYWDSTRPGEDLIAKKPLRADVWRCAYADRRMYAGFPHLYLYGNIPAAASFLRQCALHAQEKE